MGSLMNVLSQPVLVLNRLFFPVNVTTVEEAIKQMVGGAVTALNIVDEDLWYPVKWDEWTELPIRSDDLIVRSQKLTIRAPTVVIAAHYDKIPSSTPKLSHKNVKALHKSICAYTGEYAPDGNVDHIIPRARGGKNVWRNVVWSKKDINSRKGDRLNHEVGLPPVKGKEPLPSPVPLKVKTNMQPSWKPFLYA